MDIVYFLHAVAQIAQNINISVDTADNASENDTQGTDDDGNLAVGIAFEQGNWLITLHNIHGFDNEQIVVQGNNSVDQSYEHEYGKTCVKSCHEDEKFGEETCKGWYARQREQAECHNKRQFGVSLVKPVVVADVDFSAILFGDVDNEEDSKVGYHVNKEVVNQRCHALSCSSHDTKDQIASLAYGGESHESFDVILAYGKDVGNGDAENDNPQHNDVPLLNHRLKYLEKNGK